MLCTGKSTRGHGHCTRTVRPPVYMHGGTTLEVVPPWTQTGRWNHTWSGPTTDTNGRADSTNTNTGGNCQGPCPHAHFMSCRVSRSGSNWLADQSLMLMESPTLRDSSICPGQPPCKVLFVHWQDILGLPFIWLVCCTKVREGYNLNDTQTTELQGENIISMDWRTFHLRPWQHLLWLTLSRP